MGRDDLILKLADVGWSGRLISVLNLLNRKMPTGMTDEGKSLSVNLLETTYYQGYTLLSIANALGVKTV